MPVYRSNAKINIGLRILGKRNDGFHNLESVFQEISISDEIRIEKTGGDVLFSSNEPAIPADRQNLCLSAFYLLQEKCNVKGGISVELHKNIPIGAGLGGGSSNAAVCLKAFNDIFELKLSRPELLILAAQLGSDVPFFILGKTALVKGRGEVVMPLSFLNNYRLLIIFPNIEISTARVFKNFEMGLTEYGMGVKFEAVISGIRDISELSHYFYNDLEPVVFSFYPELADIKNRLYENGAVYSSMSGSGSAVYGIFSQDADLENYRLEFSANYRTFIAKPVI